MHGFAAGQWLRSLGARYRINPDFYRRHLSFLQAKDYLDLPDLPSANTTFLELRYPVLYDRFIAVGRQTLIAQREDERRALDSHHRRLSVYGVAGDSIARKFSSLTEDTFSVEYAISCFLVRKKSGAWTGKPYPPWSHSSFEL